jgi:hypothetical protein
MLTVPEFHDHEIFFLLHVVWKGMVYVPFITLTTDKRVGGGGAWQT